MEGMPRELPATRCGNRDELLAACGRIESLPIVNGIVRFDPKHNNGAGRIYANVWCCGSHSKYTEKHPYIDLNNRKADDPKVAAQKLLALLETEHAGCVEEAQAARMAAASQSSRAGASSACTRPEPEMNMFQAMMRM